MKQALIPLILAITQIVSVPSLRAEDRPFPAEVIHGNVRFVLMSVGQTTVFGNGNTNEPEHSRKSGVPCFTVTYLLELLGDKPFHATALKKFEVSSTGKPLEFLNEQHVSYQKSFDYEFFTQFLDFTKPKVTNPKRAIIFQHVEFGALPTLQPIDLLIHAGFDDDIQEFNFSSIHLQ